MTDWLTDERKSLLVGAFSWAFMAALGVLAATFLLVSTAVGAVVLIRWLGGIA